jgi:hypothetical protein
VRDPVDIRALDQAQEIRSVGVCEAVEHRPDRHRLTGGGQAVDQRTREVRLDLVG